jgi:hypothetical protein
MPGYGPAERVDLCYEGLGTTDGRLIEPGALRLPDGYVPVTARDGGGMNEVVGRASAFERRGAGPGRYLVSAEVELLDRLPYRPSQVNRHVEVSIEEGREEGDLRVVAGGALRGVFLSGDPGGWPSLDVPAAGPARRPGPPVPPEGPTLAWAVAYARLYWQFGDSAETQAALTVLRAHATAATGEAVVDHVEHPLLVDLSDHALEWLIQQVKGRADVVPTRRDVLAALEAARDARGRDGG